MKPEEKRECTFLAKAPPFLKEHCSFRSYPVSPACLSDKILINFCGMILRWEN